METYNILSRKIAFFLVIGVAIVFVLSVIWGNIHQSFFVRLLFDDAQEFARTGTITSQFMPIGYSGFVGTCINIVGVGGIPGCQALIYGGILFVIFWFFLLRGVRGSFLALGMSVVALHPALILNVWRIHDGNATALLLIAFVSVGIFFIRSKNVWGAAMFGISAGLLFVVRPNTGLLIPLAFLILLWPFSDNKKKRIIGAGVFLMGVVMSVMVVNMSIKQTPFFIGGQGFYNLFSGTNEYAAKHLRLEYSGENSLGEALMARGITSAKTFPDWLAFSPSRYKEFTLDYIQRNPWQYAKLTALKFATILRPGYHRTEDFKWISFDGLKQSLKIILSFPFFIWIFLLYKTRKNFFEKENLFTIFVVVLYIVPFLLANADPRYRFPLDIFFIADSFSRAVALQYFRKFTSFFRGTVVV